MSKEIYQLDEVKIDDVIHFAMSQRLAVNLDSKVNCELLAGEDYYKVSCGHHSWIIKSAFLPKFWLMLDTFEYYALSQLALAEDEIAYKPFVPYENITGEIDTSGSFYSLTGEDFVNVENRVSGLVTAVVQSIKETASIINTEMDLVAKDGSVVKDFDGVLTFDSPIGVDFKVHLCFDKLKPVAVGSSDVLIGRTPITPEDMKTYLRDSGPKVQSRLDHINQIVHAFTKTKAVNKDPALVDYASILINGTVLNAFLNQTIMYISFGGMDNWSIFGKENANNKECFKYLDVEIEKIIALLNSIEKTEGVDIYSMDIDTFAIFGRNFDNKVVTPALQGYTQDILDSYSKGFEQTLTARMSMIDNQHFFKA